MRRLTLPWLLLVVIVACGEDGTTPQPLPTTEGEASDGGGTSPVATDDGGPPPGSDGAVDPSGNDGGSSIDAGGGDADAAPGPNQAPTAMNGTLLLEIGDKIDSTLAGADANGDALTYSILTPPTKGTVSNLNAATGAFTYTSTELLPGSDSFTFQVSDGKTNAVTPGKVDVTLDAVLFTGHWTLSNVKDNASTACTSSQTFRIGHARPASAAGYLAVAQRRIVCGSTTYTFQPVRETFYGSQVTASVMTFSQGKSVSGCGYVTDAFRLERLANGKFAFKETTNTPCYGIGTHVFTADAERTSTGYLFVEPASETAFGNAYQGDPSPTRSVMLRNVGRVPTTTLAVSGIADPFSFAGGTFPGASGTCGTSVAGLSSCSFGVAMSTTDLGAKSGGWSASYADGLATHGESGTLSGGVVPKFTNPTAVSSGNDFACAIASGTVTCWGDTGASGVAAVPPLTNPKVISAGSAHACAIDDSGVKCWGSSANGRTTVPPLVNPKQVSAGGAHTYALDDNGVTCWGSNTSGQATVPPLTTPTAVSADGAVSCALHASGVTCWGSNTQGATVPALNNPTAVSAGNAHVCAIDATGVVCWGDNFFGKATVPVNLTPPISAISAGGARTCAIASGAPRCWGFSSAVPPVSGLTTLSTGYNHACAIAGGSVRCWGAMTYP
ncbi:MAG: hypothetical protein IPG50_04475 [Myxococcales bacterium]|nr:hypothetical protein [Myxococcales bacterium]